MDKIIELILLYVEPEEEITASSKLKNDCGLTSFDMVCLVEEIATKFGVDLSSDKIKNCVTVGDLAECVFGTVTA